MLTIAHQPELAGPNPIAADAIVFARLDAAASGDDLDLAVERVREAFPEWLPASPAGSSAVLRTAFAMAHWARSALNEIRGAIQAAGARESAQGTLLWVGYHQADLSRSALDLAVWVFTGAAQPRGLDMAQARQRLEALWERCKLAHPDYQAQVLMQGARANDIPWLMWLPSSKIWQFGWGARGRQFEETQPVEDSAIGTRVQSSKLRTKWLMVTLGIRTPVFMMVQERHELEEAARLVGWPCVLKPNDLGGGRGVTAGIRDMSELIAAFEAARAITSKPLMVEKFVRGSDHRLMVHEGRLVAAIRREASSVVGDGVRTVKELVDELNRPRSRNMPRSRYLRVIPFDGVLDRQLATQGMHLQAVPAAGQVLKLRSNANLSTGGICIDETARVHPAVAQSAEMLAQALAIRYCGIDYITPDISQSEGRFIEANITPGIDALIAGGLDPVAVASQLLGSKPGRIPVRYVVVAAQQVKAIAAALRQADRPSSVGWVCGAFAGVGTLALQVESFTDAIRAVLLNSGVEEALVVGSAPVLMRMGMPLDKVAETVVCTDLPDAWWQVLQARSGSVRRGAPDTDAIISLCRTSRR